MRPIYLEMQAFGSYGDKTVVDFEKPNQNLFLVTGDTGAGKTTIFDAIVFAIYGEASSQNNKKDGAELQSHFADLAKEPYVELTFSEEGEIYKVRREPRHKRLNKRGGGTTDVKEVIALTMPDGISYTGGQKETDEKLEEIVGLTKNQFMQVAMVAQGEFMELLRAKTSDKKEIFRKLFHTEQYDLIVRELDRRRKDKMDEIDRIRIECQNEIARVVVTEAFPEAGRLAELTRTIGSASRLNPEEMKEFIIRLGGLVAFLSERKAQAQTELERLGKVRDARRDEYVQGEGLLSLFEQKEQAKKRLEELRTVEDDMKKMSALAVQIRLAYDLKILFDHMAEKEKELKEIRDDLNQKQAELPGMKEVLTAAQESEANARDAKEREAEAFARTEERVKKARDVFDRIDAAIEDVKCREKAAKEAEDETQKSRNALEEYQQCIACWKKAEAALADAPAKYSVWTAKREKVDELARELKAAALQKTEADRQREAAGDAKQAYESCRILFDAKDTDYKAANLAFLDAQAGYLAKEKLRPGQPCPVCGSTEHPNPCRLPEDEEIPTREQLDVMKAELDMVSAELSSRAAASAQAESLACEKESTLKLTVRGIAEKLGKEVGDLRGDEEIGELKKAFETWKEALLTEGEKLAADSEEYAATREKLSGSDAELRLRSEKCTADEQAFHSAGQALAEARTKLQGLREQMQYESREAAENEGKAAAKKKADADDAWAKANAAAVNAKTAIDNLVTLIRNHEERIPQLESDVQKRRDDYHKALEEKQLPHWADITSVHEKSEEAEFQEKVEAFKVDLANAEGAAKGAEEAVAGKEMPNMEMLAEARDAAEKALADAQTLLDGFREQYNTDREVLGSLEPKMDDRSRKAEEYARLDGLYNRLAGKVTGSRMDLETLALRYYLQKILCAANRRFLEMSAGQYELRMIDQEEAGDGRNKGLDLMVYSAVTGKEREVRTLSGGESFMAALALALGMADQIQESRAAVNLDMMFIDEGFGSLDDHSRNQAVRVLQQMAGGQKLIGIISHVTELKQEIEDQLIVTKDENGSHVKWQIS